MTADLVGKYLAVGGVTAEALDGLSAPEPVAEDEWVAIHGLFHARTLPDDRAVAVVADSDEDLGVFRFVRDGDRWRIDGRASPPWDLDSHDQGVIGTTYTDPGGDYSYGIEWAAPWQLVHPNPNSSGGSNPLTPYFGANHDLTYDGIHLENGPSALAIGAIDLVGEFASLPDLASCRDVDPRGEEVEQERIVETRGNLIAVNRYVRDSVTPARDGAGRPLRGEEAGRAWAAYDLDYATADDFGLDGEPHPGSPGMVVVPGRLWVECREIAGGRAAVTVVHLAPRATYDTDAAARDAVLATIEG